MRHLFDALVKVGVPKLIFLVKSERMVKKNMVKNYDTVLHNLFSN